ncbi:hypothetical protein ACLOJK_035878 [Asimina triloba]
MESLLGRGQKAARRRCWCDDGRISADRARFTQSPPSTVPILTSEFVIADRRAFKRFDGEETARLPEEARFLWKLHRKEPGCVVGEHMQVRRCAGGADFLMTRSTAMERPGEEGRASKENRTVGDEPRRLTRVGDAEREKRAEDWREKEEEEEAKAGEESLPEGEIERCRFDDEIGRTGPLDLLVLEALAAIAVGRMNEILFSVFFLSGVWGLILANRELLQPFIYRRWAGVWGNLSMGLDIYTLIF